MAAINPQTDSISNPNPTLPVEESPASSQPDPKTVLPDSNPTPAELGALNSRERERDLNVKNLELKPAEKGDAHAPSSILTPITTMRPVSPLGSRNSSRPSASPHRARNTYISPSSPNRAFRSASPRMHSPASSQIFERDVQEDITPAQASPSIPSHIMTENHIPPILEASSAALTDDRLDPDSVEIVTHNFHQPAALSVTGAGPTEHSMTSSWHEDLSPHIPPDVEDFASKYGSLEPADVRRLSFISFADVVHGEHAAESDHISNRDSVYLAGLSTNAASLAAHNRSPSPIRSPVSSHGFGTSPPTSVSPSTKGVESSPSRGGGHPAGSPRLCGHSPPPGTFGGELNIETMRQALRRTGSGDFGGYRSQPMSAVGNDDGTYDRPFK
ncbi:hypothetical protein FQN50_001505 [Emmonsiellopsis sp. PD_5]|nr:hypothetical protein FQN50_001505 [Emmonsiellopsis sp. PD_5]